MSAHLVLGGLRSSVGLLAWFTPSFLLRLSGISIPHSRNVHPRHILLTRLFGIRDFLMGASILAASGYLGNDWRWGGETHRFVVLMGLISDLTDVMAVSVAMIQGETEALGAQALVVVGVGAAGFAALGASILNKLS